MAYTQLTKTFEQSEMLPHLRTLLSYAPLQEFLPQLSHMLAVHVAEPR